jgi:hypothetical protein
MPAHQRIHRETWEVDSEGQFGAGFVVPLTKEAMIEYLDGG